MYQCNQENATWSEAVGDLSEHAQWPVTAIQHIQAGDEVVSGVGLQVPSVHIQHPIMITQHTIRTYSAKLLSQKQQYRHKHLKYGVPSTPLPQKYLLYFLKVVTNMALLYYTARPGENNELMIVTYRPKKLAVIKEVT